MATTSTRAQEAGRTTIRGVGVFRGDARDSVKNLCLLDTSLACNQSRQSSLSIQDQADNALQKLDSLPPELVEQLIDAVATKLHQDPPPLSGDLRYTMFNAKTNLIKFGFSRHATWEERLRHYERLDGWKCIAVGPGSYDLEQSFLTYLRELGFNTIVGREYFYASEKLLKAARTFGWPIGDLLKAKTRASKLNEARRSRGIQQQQNLFGGF